MIEESAIKKKEKALEKTSKPIGKEEEAMQASIFNIYKTCELILLIIIKKRRNSERI